MQLYNKSAAELSQLLTSKEISATELLKDTLKRINETEDKIGAFVTVSEEEAILQAENVDKKRANGEILSPLAGVPIAIKDNICTKDILTTCSSKMLSNFVPPYNASAVEKLYAQNAVIIGKTNMDEFAMGSSTETSYFKPTKNPHDLQYVPGGSSGGSAAAVAAGQVAIALGSDTGGSIRQPAAYCGVVGLKPTYGSISRYGLIAFASSLDQIGPFGKTVKDTAMLFDAIKGVDKNDATSVSFNYNNILSSLDNDIKGIKIGVPVEYMGDGVDTEVKEEVLKTVEILKSLGAEVKEVSLPSTDYALPSYYIISSAEASSNLARYDGVKYGYRSEEFSNLTELYENTRSEGFGDEVKRRIMLGTFVLSSGYYDAYYNRAKLLQRRISSEFSTAFENCDILITPTAPSTAFKLGENISSPLKMYASDICTINVNIAGLPAISLPMGSGKNGMPIGVQLIGNKFSEEIMLNVSHKIEMAIGSFNKTANL